MAPTPVAATALPLPKTPPLQHQDHLHTTSSLFTNYNQKINLTKANFISTTTITTNSLITLKGESIQKQEGEWQGYRWPSAMVQDVDALCRNGRLKDALEFLQDTNPQGIPTDTYIYASLLHVCANRKAIEEGKQVHAHILINGLEQNVFLGAKLVRMYAMCGCIADARLVFDKISKRYTFLWNVIIRGYVRNGLCEEAFKLYYQMQLAGVNPDTLTFPSVLKACAGLSALQQGKEIHGKIIRSGFESDGFVGCALVDLYSKCGDIDAARHVFDKMSERDIVSWSAMIAGYAKNGRANEAVSFFNQMQLAGTKPNLITVVGVLPAFAHLAALQQGKEIHDYIIRNGFELDVNVGNSLIFMYAKCGNVALAHKVFDKMSQRNVASWTAMIAGYGMNGNGEDALAYFRQMQQAGVKPNHITFVAVLAACSHAGLMAEGWQYFHCMAHDYQLTPRVQHYTCMVDLLGRAGLLSEAEDFIQKMPMEPDAAVWGALLSSCRIHCNADIGERVAKHLLELEPKNDGNYVLLSNIYAEQDRWDDVVNVRTLMKEKCLQRKPGCSWIEVKNKVHTFHVGDRSHPQTEEIYSKLDALARQMKEAGYVPDTSLVLHDVGEEEKEFILCGHSERLAIAFGLLNTCHGTSIRITKNLRVCSDCHTASKLISKSTGREIVVRDVNRYHHFKDGMCSCGDYW